MPRRNPPQTFPAAAARIKALEDQVDALIARVDVLEALPDPLPGLAELAARVRVLEAAQPYTLAG